MIYGAQKTAVYVCGCAWAWPKNKPSQSKVPASPTAGQRNWFNVWLDNLFNVFQVVVQGQVCPGIQLHTGGPHNAVRV